MNNDTVKELGKLNAQIDVWIDEERYGEIENTIESDVIPDACFDDTYCTNNADADKDWRAALADHDKPATLKDGSPIDKHWSKLFYAKLLRARIQRKGTDCYFRRLDQVVAYLERHIPDPYEDEPSARLVVLYLVELSSASLPYESLGFAERARRVLHESKYLRAGGKDGIRWYYELLARYNIGVAHFHESSYRKALLEFNYIIFEIDSFKEKAAEEGKEEAEFYKRLLGDSMLYLPAIIYRADTQLKLQLAYHALKTLDRCRSELERQEHGYKRLKADLIEIQAYQLMDRLDQASEILKRVWKDLFREEREFPYFARNDGNEEMTCVEAFDGDIGPETDRQNAKGRLLSLAMDQHLNCLRRQKELLTSEDGKADNHDNKLIEWINSNCEYLKELGEESFLSYFKAVEFQAPNRVGYWEQVADYLAWLAGNVGESDIAGIAEFCNTRAGKEKKKKLIDYLLEKSPREYEDEQLPQEDKVAKQDCLYCTPKGIELARLGQNHYDDFCDRMLEVLEKQDVLGLGPDGNRQDEFIKRVLRVEEKHRYGLRIKDLRFRYKSKTATDRLGKRYCWPSISGDKIRAFDILPCLLIPEERESLSEPVRQAECVHPSTCYQRVIEQWDDYFLHHLEAPSIHERQEPGLYFLGLQRWNSSSPAEGYSLGGGYLLYNLHENREVDFGIAIDPGFDFIRNLFHTGFSLNDINIVLISHAHIDHIRDFESIVTLLFELAKRRKRHRKVHVILTLSVYKRLEYLIENPKLRLHIEPYIIDIDREIETDYFEKLPDERSHSFCFERPMQSDASINRFQPVINNDGYIVRVRPTRAYHDDHSGYSDSFGFLIDIRSSEDSENVTIGYTGDTKWIYSDPEIEDPIKDNRLNKKAREISDIVSQYRSCAALIVHLGSLITKNEESKRYCFLEYSQCISNDSSTRCEDLVQKEGHPYLIGLLRILTSLYEQYDGSEAKKPLILIGEFGEELRGKIRVDLVKRLIGIYGERMNLLPVDVGITVQLKCEGEENTCGSSGVEKRILCVQCNRLVAIGEADFEHFGPDEAIFCVCKTCLKGTPFDVLQNRLRHLCEVGYELHPARRSH